MAWFTMGSSGTPEKQRGRSSPSNDLNDAANLSAQPGWKVGLPDFAQEPGCRRLVRLQPFCPQCS
eukprot:2082252-Pyramimonas_sp.AAC.1